jgi:hypothetical protein
MRSARSMSGDVSCIRDREFTDNLTWQLSAPRMVSVEHTEQSRATRTLLRARAARRWAGGALQLLIGQVGGLEVPRETVVSSVAIRNRALPTILGQGGVRRDLSTVCAHLAHVCSVGQAAPSHCQPAMWTERSNPCARNGDPWRYFPVTTKSQG